MPDYGGLPKLHDVCDAMTRPRGGYPAGRISDCLLLDEKCIKPAEVVGVFVCDLGHVIMGVKCAEHGVDSNGLCGNCAVTGYETGGRWQAAYRL